MLGDQVSCINKIKKEKKNREKRKERGKTYLPRFHQQVDPASFVV